MDEARGDTGQSPDRERPGEVGGVRGLPVAREGLMKQYVVTRPAPKSSGIFISVLLRCVPQLAFVTSVKL